MNIKSFNKFQLNENVFDGQIDSIYNMYQNNPDNAYKMLCDLVYNYTLTELKDLMLYNDDAEFKYWLKTSIIKCVTNEFKDITLVQKSKAKGDFTQTIFSKDKDFILRIYGPDGEVADSKPITARTREDAEIIALDILNSDPNYDEDAGWDYMVT